MIAAGFENVDASLLRDLLIIAAAVVGLALGVKKLFFEKQATGFTQPFMVQLQKEFVDRIEYERRQTDLEAQVKDGRAYTHEQVHGLSEIVNAANIDARSRNERLSALEADSKTHTRQLENVNGKLDRIVERVADKVEALLHKERGAQ